MSASRRLLGGRELGASLPGLLYLDTGQAVERIAITHLNFIGIARDRNAYNAHVYQDDRPL
jgi:hypothetical protein